MLSPEQFAALLPSHPRFSNLNRGRRVVVEVYHHPPSTIRVPGLRDTLLVFHLKGPIAVEQWSGGSWQRRWTNERQVSITPPDEPVTRRFQGRPEVLLLQIDPGLLSEVALETADGDPGSVSVAPSFAQTDAQLDAYARLLLDESRAAEEPGAALALDLLERMVTLHVLRRHSSLGTIPAAETVRISPARLQRVIEYMHEAQSLNPTLVELADLCRLSPTHFARAFRAATGMPPHRYLIAVRLAEARRLLEETRLPITEIAALCGYEQASSFATAFRKHVGVTPRAWRTDRLR